MIPSRVVRYLAKIGPELAVSVGVTAVCFLAFLALLSVTFRQGTSLQDLMSDRTTLTRWTREGVPSQLEFTTTGSPDAVVALLTSTRNDVKDKPASGLSWQESRAGTPLRNRHSVQTFHRSEAVINFGASNELRVGENALVVVKSFHEAHESGKPRRTLVVLGGELQARLSRSAHDSLQVEVETANATRLRAGGSDDTQVELRVAVDETGSSEIAVLEGSAEVEREGTTRAVAANEAVFVDSVGHLSEPEPLPPPPRLVAPENGTEIVFRDQSPRLAFTWSGSAAEYDLTLAHDAAFTDVVHRERLSGARFVYGNLKEGAYYWRVVAVRGRAKSVGAVAGPIRVVQDLTPPELVVHFPGETVAAPEVVLRGKAEPGADVYLDDRQVRVAADGSFERRLPLSRGLNVIVVEAIDAAGNVTYRSGTVTASY